MPLILILKKIAGTFINKKRVAGWIGAAVIAAAAVGAGMESQELKDAICGAPLLQPIATEQK